MQQDIRESAYIYELTLTNYIRQYIPLRYMKNRRLENNHTYEQYWDEKCPSL